MYKSIKFFTIFLSLAMLNGCASSCGSVEQTSNQNNNTNQAGNVIVPKRADNSNVSNNANSNTMVNGLANFGGKNPTLDNSKVKVIDTTNTKSTVQAKKMPDNSEMSTTMDEKGNFVETRKFINNPDLDKLERIIKDPKNIKLKVYLKNGKVYDLAEGKLKNYKTDAAYSILEAVGVKPTVPANTGEKKKVQ